MGRKVVEQIIETCDRCGEDFKDVNNSKNGKMYISCDELDSTGILVGPGDRVNWIFCDGCYNYTTAYLIQNFKETKKAYS